MLESMVLSVPLWPKGVGPTDAPIICTYNSHVNETLYAKNSVVHMVNGRACAKGIRVLFVIREGTGNNTTGVVHCGSESKERHPNTFRVFVLYKATWYDLDHSSALHGIGVHLIIAIDCERHAPLIEMGNCGFSTSSW